MKPYTITSAIALILGVSLATTGRVINRDFQSFTPLIAARDNTFTPITAGSSTPDVSPPSFDGHPPSITRLSTDANSATIGKAVFSDLKLGQCLPIDQPVPFRIENQSKFAFFVTTEPDCNVTGIVFPAPQGVVSWFDHGTHFLVATEDIYRLPWDKTN
ncbi:hypothetical protein [Absidia glauca]|uniref:Uncharacterized protein n=1 Tax=Absidia glauca TaxID=4829 RepID=A0A168LIG6_ABSGL|nr:hypothetical protein [Absidia glauca]